MITKEEIVKITIDEMYMNVKNPYHQPFVYLVIDNVSHEVRKEVMEYFQKEGFIIINMSYPIGVIFSFKVEW